MKKFSKPASSGAVVYEDYRDNFVIWPGREPELREFVSQTYSGLPHKLEHTKSSNSEDALTWSCFDTLRCLPPESRKPALTDLWTLAFDGSPPSNGFLTGEICIGKKYGEPGEETEVDVSIEGAEILVFVEAKLYSSMSMADPEKLKPHDQIARKLRVGLKEARRSGKEFYFILLDIAPKELLRKLGPGVSLAEASRKDPRHFANKWQTAYWFTRYKRARGGVTPLREILKDISGVDAQVVAGNMGWLTWSDVYKAVLRAVIECAAGKANPVN